MRRHLLRALIVVIALPLLMLAAIVVLANTGPGQRLIERQTTALTNGAVRLQGLAGRFPDALRVARLQVADAGGVYLDIADLSLDWSPLTLLSGAAKIDQLAADQVVLSRLPRSQPASAEPSGAGGGFSLPLRVTLTRLAIRQARIGPVVAGAAATLGITGQASLRALWQGTAQLDIHRLDQPGDYHADASLDGAALTAALTAQEPANGLLATLAGLPDLGAISLRAQAKGPFAALVTHLDVTAGALTATAGGTIDLAHDAADVTVHAQAPAMRPAPELAWGGVLVDAHVTGPFARVDATGTVRLTDLGAYGTRIAALDADLSGNAGHVALRAIATGLRLPGPKPDLLAADPLRLDAAADLAAADRPVRFTVHQALFDLTGTALTGPRQQVQAHLTLPDLTPLAQAGGIDLQGHAALDLTAARQDQAIATTVTGSLALTGGAAPLPALIGTDGRIDLAATLGGGDVALRRLTLAGRGLRLGAAGGLTGGTLALDWSTDLTDLAALRPDLSGSLHATGHAAGPLSGSALTATADIAADLAAAGYRTGRVTAHIDAGGLPDAPHAAITAGGTLLDAPLSLALTADRTAGALHAEIGSLRWKSLQAAGSLRLTQGAMLPTGTLHLAFSRLADLQPLLNRPLRGAAEATLTADDQAAHLSASVSGLALPGVAEVGKADLRAAVTDPIAHPALDATLGISGATAATLHGATAQITAKGPLSALAVTVAAEAPALAGAAARLTAAATVDAPAKAPAGIPLGRTVALNRLEAVWNGQTVRLLAPARFDLADGVAIDRLRLGFRQAELSLAGRASPTLDLTATLRDLPADVAAIADPALAADGHLDAALRLTGTAAQPRGQLRATAAGLHLRQGSGQALPPADATLTATLQGSAADIDARITAGQTRATVTGAIPLGAAGALNLRTQGRLDLAMLDPLLAADGRRARGIVTLNASVGGTVQAPRVAGSAELRNGDVVDYGLGLHIADLAAQVQADGDTLRLASLTGRAGPGTIGGSGTIGLMGAMPVDLHLTATNARPLASDLLTAWIDQDLTLRGDLTGDMSLDGTVHVRRAEIRIPDTLPPSVAVLPVRTAGAPPPPPPPAHPTRIALNLTLDAPQQVFVRGRGLDAELGGRIQFQGTVDQPRPDGSLKLRHGTLSVIGRTLSFTDGEVSFTGAGLTDPSLHFVAATSNSAMTATLTVGGTARKPTITLGSTPTLPQDEVLAQLLFNTSVDKLSPLQLAQMASALATLSGAASGLDPLDKVRAALGLDRLSVGTGSAGSPTLEAGRYVARGVYVGARQGTSGGGPRATVQIDLAKGLRAEATAGAAQESANGAGGGADSASVGLTYHFDY